MLNKHFTIKIILVLFISFLVISCGSSQERSSLIQDGQSKQISQIPVKVIFDTDISGDWDDIGALAVLHAYVNANKAEILAMGVSALGHTAKWGPSCVDAINTFYNRPDIPIGICAAGFNYAESPYNREISEEFPNEIDKLYNAAKLYRKVLSQQPDNSVVLLSIGYMDNISELLNTNADEYSELSGIELVKKKVKIWVCMGGAFPGGGPECNVNTTPINTKFAIDNWPRPILFSGREIGSVVFSGSRLIELPETNPIRRAYELAGGLGHRHHSFDQTAVMAAIENPELYWDIVGHGKCSMSTNPSIGTQWYSTPDKGHAYLKEKMNPMELEKVIDSLMIALPLSIEE